MATRVVDDPLPSGGVGLLTLVGVPILLVLVAITIIGIPLAILGAFLFALLAWTGAIYGAFALGTLLLGLAERPNRWGALLLGVVLLALLGLIPFVGGLLAFVIFLLGLGGLVLELYGRYQHRRNRPRSEAGVRSPVESP